MSRLKRRKKKLKTNIKVDSCGHNQFNSTAGASLRNSLRLKNIFIFTRHSRIFEHFKLNEWLDFEYCQGDPKA